MPIRAPIVTQRSTPYRWMYSSACATGAALRNSRQFWIPVRTMATEQYRIVQMMSDAMIPKGTSF